MSIAGEKSTLLAPLVLVDEVLGNADGTTGRQSVNNLALQLMGTTALGALANTGGFFPTYADLPAASTRDLRSGAIVYDDPDGNNNGTWTVQLNEAGTKAWFYAFPLQISIIRAADNGEGLANALQMTSKSPVADGILTVFKPFRDTAAGGVTVSFNGDTALTVRDAGGNLLAAAQSLKQGVSVAGMRAGNYFDLLTDVDAAVNAASAAASALQASAARDVALSAVPNAFPLTRAAMRALSTSTHISSYLLEPNREGVFRFKSGNFSAAVAADTSEGVYVAAADTDPGIGALVRLYQGAVSVRWFGATGDGSTDDRAACQAAIDFVTRAGGGDVHFPDGTYRLVGAANADGLANGLVIPFQSFSIDNRVRLIANGNATLKAASNNMVVVRLCQPGSEVIGLHVDGGYDYANPGSSLSGTWGIGLVPANRNQITTLVSQSFCKVLRCHVRNCTEGLVLEPGPTVSGSQSGAFYPIVEDCDFNLNRRSMWFKSSITDPTNRPTRGNIAANRIERGNCGIDLEYATEFTLLGNNFQFFKSTYATTPIATACAIHVGANSEGNVLYGGEAEQCDNDIFNEGTATNALLVPLGFSLGGVNTGMSFSPVQQPTFIRLARRTASYEQMFLAANFTGFARLVFDYTASNVRDAAIETNSVKRMDWFNGKTTHYGSAGNIELLNTGATIQGTASTGLTVTTSGTTLALNAGGKTATISSAGLLPGADNSVALGTTAFRFTQLSAATATINTSDGTLKDWRGGLDEVEMRIAKKLSKLIGIYRWKDAIEKKGDEARLHAGVIVQDAMKIFEDEGRDPFAYGLICRDEWDDYTEAVTELREVAILDEDGNPKIDETGQPVTEMQEVDTGVVRIVKEAGHLYGLRYDELWAFVAAGFEARLSALEGA